MKIRTSKYRLRSASDGHLCCCTMLRLLHCAACHDSTTIIRYGYRLYAYFGCLVLRLIIQKVQRQILPACMFRGNGCQSAWMASALIASSLTHLRRCGTSPSYLAQVRDRQACN